MANIRKLCPHNYYDEERMNDEINEALNYDPDFGFNDVPDHTNDPYEYLSNFELNEEK